MDKQAVWDAEVLVGQFINFIGDDSGRPGLRDTPRRVARAWTNTWGAGYTVTDDDIKRMLVEFEDGAENYDQFIIVRDIPFYSHCEHHLAPFFGVAHIGYIPKKAITGLSKFPRLVEAFSRRLQVQERLTRQIGDAIQKHLRPLACGVVLEARHLCMESRGVRTPGATTLTSALYGAVKFEADTRAEFYKLIGK